MLFEFTVLLFDTDRDTPRAELPEVLTMLDETLFLEEEAK